ncbi:SDR family NAD(P)-dependent oxidoreductase [Nonomuraea dietziae]|uniref:SDR family NAD(P)-dependent oxidoreductase n=1 Tax=Nonomuraea dietziae TaxID=65515 RepID=UPI0034066F97
MAASAHQLQVTDPASVVRCFADISSRLGRLDMLVNNADIAIDRRQAAANPDFEKVHATLEANLLGRGDAAPPLSR